MICIRRFIISKPIDPRNNGLKAPRERITEVGTIDLDALDYDGCVKLQTLVSAYAKACKDHEMAGHTIESEPVIDFGTPVQISYTFSFVNPHYDLEKSKFDERMLAYENDKALYLSDEKAYDNASLDNQIKHTEAKLERLKAERANVQ
jgi:hypothetical protein